MVSYPMRSSGAARASGLEVPMTSLARAAAIVLLLLLTACGTFEVSVERTPAPGVDPNTPAGLSAQNSQSPTEFAPPKSLASTPMPLPQPTPEDVLGGGTVSDGPFIFDLRLFRDPSLNRHPVAASLYSDLDGFGAWMYWFYNGAAPIGPVESHWGTLSPDGQVVLDQLLQASYPLIHTGSSGGREGGVLLPGGFFTPGQSAVGDRIHVALKVTTPAGDYGAVLVFSIEQGLNGFEPTGISVDNLPPSSTTTP